MFFLIKLTNYLLKLFIPRNRLLRDVQICGKITACNGQWNRAVTKDLTWPKNQEIPSETLQKYGYKDMTQFRNWRWFKGFGGGAISDLGAHQIDIFAWFLGARPKSVMASGSRAYFKKDWAENVMCIFDYENSFQDMPVQVFYQVLTTTSGTGGYWETFMGDNGTLYQTFDSTLCSAMLRLVRKADIITPNFTEAMLLTGLDDGFRPQGMRTIRDQVSVLRSLGPSKGVITGIPLEAGGLGNAAWDGDEVRIFQYEDAGISYPGSGDLFASLLFGLSIKGGSFFGSAKHATDIATYAVSSSRKSGRERKLGIMLQPVMDEIRRRML